MNRGKRIDDAEQIIENHNGNMTNMSGMDSGTLTNSTMKASRRLMRPWICPALLLLSMLVALLLTAPGALAQTCMEDLSEFDNLVCTANDVRVARYNVISGPPSCVAGENITVVLQAELVATANERYDTGFFVALDGGDALNGSCYRDYLIPPLCPRTEDPTCVYNPVNGPFYNAEFEEDPGDTCGDLEQNVTTYRNLSAITIKCQDSDNDGIADVGTSVAWDNLKSDGSEQKPSCTGIDDTLPNTKSKCNSEAVQVGEIEVLGQIIVDKVTDPSGDPQSFDFSLTGGPNNVDVSFSLTHADDPFESEGLKAGNYSVKESVPSGWELTSAICDDDRDPSAINLAPGEIVTCTFNDRLLQGTLTLVKTVINDSGGMATADEFQAHIDDSPVPWDVAQTLIAGEYTVSEDVLPGYAASDWGGDCAANGSVIVEPGVDKTCTITNDDIAPTLTLVKTVINDSGGTATEADFNAYIDGSPVAWDVVQTLSAGSYTASEDELFGYAASAWGGDCTANGSVTLAVGENKTCTITNDDIAPKLTVIKHVINDDGGTLLAEHFAITVSGTAVADGSIIFPGEESGTTLELNAGTFNVTETDAFEYFYTATFAGDCSGTLTVGDVKNCTITNDDNAPAGQPSIEINSLSGSLDETRQNISGEFDITDDSEGGNKPDGFLILLSHYDLDWEYKTIEGPYGPNDPNGPEGGSLTINGQTVTYTCTYNIVDIDGVAGNPAGYESGDQVIFDESITIAYECQYDQSIPDTGTLRGTVTADIFGRPDMTFTFRQDFPL